MKNVFCNVRLLPLLLGEGWGEVRAKSFSLSVRPHPVLLLRGEGTYRVSYGYSGQALVSLLVFMIIAIIITSGAIVITLTSSINTSKVSLGTTALQVAETGIENALIRFLRDPSYTGETLSVGGGEATITVTGGGPYTIRSIGTLGNFERTIEVTVHFNNNEMVIDSWEEVY